MVLWPTEVHPPIGISIGSAVFADFTNVSNRHTDKRTYYATPSVAMGVHLIYWMHAMRPFRNNNNNNNFYNNQLYSL